MQHQQAGFTIREAQPVDYPGAIEALTDAFSTDPVMIEAFGGAMDRAKLTELLKFQVNTTYAPKGKIDVAIDDNNTVLGASLWVDPPGPKGWGDLRRDAFSSLRQDPGFQHRPGLEA